jgi:hypothetical protein
MAFAFSQDLALRDLKRFNAKNDPAFTMARASKNYTLLGRISAMAAQRPMTRNERAGEPSCVTSFRFQ